MTTVLLTCFEPFDGRPVNASAAAVERVVQSWSGPGRLVTARLPVSFAQAPARLADAVAAHGPDLVVCVGEAARAAVGLERVAVNVADARIADNDGSTPRDEPLAADGPAAYFTSLPLRRCLAAAHASGIPVEVSDTAGTYVCNATFYALMRLLSQQPTVTGGFVHVPLTPDQAGDGRPSLSSDDAGTVLAAVVRAALAEVSPA
jgi:pyroglutamyl-peptidase